MRKCYSAPCRFFADDTRRTNRINWYFVPADSLVYDQRTVFTPRIDDSDDTSDLLTEPTAIRTRERVYDEGANRWGTTGLHVDGDAQDFLGQSPRSKYYIGGAPPTNPCGLVTHDLCFFAFADLDDTFHHHATDVFALVFGFSDHSPFGPPFVDTLALCFGTSDHEPLLPVDHDAYGLIFALDESFPYALPVKDALAFALGLADHLPVPVPVADALAVQLGDASATPGGTPATDRLALCLGISDHSPSDFIILETGDYILQEDGVSKIKTEV